MDLELAPSPSFPSRSWWTWIETTLGTWFACEVMAVADRSLVVLLFSLGAAGGRTLARSGNGSESRPLGCGSALYNRAPAAQWVAAPQHLSGANHDEPTVWCLQQIYRPPAFFRPNG
jgi:hypothetical protein